MDGLVGVNRLKDIWKRIFSAMKIITGDVDFENDGTLQKQIFDLKEKLETPEVIVIDGDTVTPINDVEIWIKCAGIDDTYKYTTLTQVLADNTCMYSLTSDENSMKYLTRSTGFAEELCANENFMTYLGQSAYVDTSLLNSDLWVTTICNSSHMDKIFDDLVPTMTGYSNETCLISCSDEYTSNRAWRAFDKDTVNSNVNCDGWTTERTKNAHWLNVKFLNKVIKVYKVILYGRSNTNNNYFSKATIQYSDDGTNYYDLQEISSINFASNLKREEIITNDHPFTSNVRIIIQPDDMLNDEGCISLVELFIYGRNK